MFLSDALQHTQYRAPPVSSSGNIVAKTDYFTNLHLLLEPSIWQTGQRHELGEAPLC
jgi:hypothetical protein